MRVKTGIKGLDEMLNGGLLPGRVVLISGPTGSGKTILGVQFIYNGIKYFDEPGIFITLEQSKKKIKEDMRALGMDLDELGDKFRLIGGPIAKIKYNKEKTKAKLEDFIKEVEEVVKEVGAKRVVIDSINLFLLLFKTDEEKRRALLELTETLSRLNCTALLTCEVRENTFDISWWGFEQFVVDGVITLYNVKQGSIFQQGIAIRKMRGTKHVKDIVPYRITDKGIVVYPEEPWLAIEKKK